MDRTVIYRMTDKKTRSKVCKADWKKLLGGESPVSLLGSSLCNGLESSIDISIIKLTQNIVGASAGERRRDQTVPVLSTSEVTAAARLSPVRTVGAGRPAGVSLAR